MATRPLFYKVDESKLYDPNRTYASFIKLLDNYAIRTTDPEHITPKEEIEQQNFLTQILKTQPIKLAHRYSQRTRGSFESVAAR